MKEIELNIVIELIDREIENFISVRDRVNKKDDWQEKIDDLENIREKLKTKIEYE